MEKAQHQNTNIQGYVHIQATMGHRLSEGCQSLPVKENQLTKQSSIFNRPVVAGVVLQTPL